MFARARLFLRSLKTRRFDAAGGGRRWDARPSFGSISAEALAAAAPIRSRARYFSTNNPWAANGIEALKVGLVGSGVMPAAQHPDPVIRKALGAYFAKFSAECDADGRTDFGGIQGAVARGMPIDGEAFLHMPITSDGLRLRVIPPEMVDESKTAELGGGARIIGGIEFDSAGRRVGYWILPSRPENVFATSGPSVRVPADEICHVFAPLGAGQVRGVSWLASVLLRLSELDQSEDAMIVGLKVAAMHAGFLVDQNGNATGSPYGDGQADPKGILESGLEPGTLKIIPPGWDIKFSTPQQASQAIEFLQFILRAIAAGLGVPEHLLTGDLSRANYSSLRAALVAFRMRLESIQFNVLIPQFLNPVWRRAITFGVLSGELAAPDFETNTAAYFAVDWHPPALPWVDPKKDVDADVAAIAAGIRSRRQVVASQGYDIETLDAEIAADRAREKALGLDFNAKPKGQPNAA